MVGALAAYLLARIEIAYTQVRWRILPGCPIGYGAVTLAARAETAGFDPYNQQITKKVLDVWGRVVAARAEER
jgi:hypothetical protein